MRSNNVSIFAIVLLVACSGGGGTPNQDPTGPSPPGTPSTPPVNATVSMISDSDGYSAATHAFSPEAVTVSRNGSVTWTNGTGVQHNVTFSGIGAPSSIADHTSGSNARVFSTAGTFNYSCTNHGGMAGTVTVQ
jgi:plastocyanin